MFEVLTAVVMKITVLWDTAMCCWLEKTEDFGTKIRLYLQCCRITRAREQCKDWGVKQGDIMCLCLPLAFTQLCVTSQYATLQMEAKCSTESSVSL
jgi:hypothetical protein